MYVFYDVQDLVLLEKLQLVKLITEKGFCIKVSQLRLNDYTGKMVRQIQALANKKMIEIIDQKIEVFEFVEEQDEVHISAGKSLLGLIHFCKSEGLILVVDEKETMVNELADLFSVSRSTLTDFYKETINDEKYINFMMELKGISV